MPGYARGACVHGDVLHVGTSALRLRSLHGLDEERRRSTVVSQCAIHVVDIRSGATRTWNLDRDRREIYDLCVIAR